MNLLRSAGTETLVFRPVLKYLSYKNKPFFFCLSKYEGTITVAITATGREYSLNDHLS